MAAFVIIPGIGGSDDQHWQTRWERQWGPAAVRIAPESWSHPDRADWVDAIQRAVDEASSRGDVVLIAHSLGCWAAAAWLERASQSGARPPVTAALLVAPPDLSGAAFPRAEAASFLNVEPRTLPCPSLVVASTTDPYAGLDVAECVAARWGSRLEVVGDLGHINSASELGDWPQGRELLASLLEG